MRSIALLLVASVALAACAKGAHQADALDNAAAQADPAAAVAMRNEADQIRAGESDANLSDPTSPAQAAMANAGAAAAQAGPAPAPRAAIGTRELVTSAAPATAPAKPGTDTRAAHPHKAGEPVPNTDTPTPVANHY